jgi:lysophospholipase L1-like esterase
VGPIGEDPASTNPLQSEINRRIEEYSAIIMEIARAEGVGYIPVYEALLAQIAASPGKAFTSVRFLSFYRDAFRVLALRKSPDEIARMNGWRCHSDGIHPNSRGGMIVADLVQEFIDKDDNRSLIAQTLACLRGACAAADLPLAPEDGRRPYR